MMMPVRTNQSGLSTAVVRVHNNGRNPMLHINVTKAAVHVCSLHTITCNYPRYRTCVYPRYNVNPQHPFALCTLFTSSALAPWLYYTSPTSPGTDDTISYPSLLLARLHKHLLSIDYVAVKIQEVERTVDIPSLPSWLWQKHIIYYRRQRARPLLLVLRLIHPLRFCD
jgi:hypothetical protein